MKLTDFKNLEELLEYANATPEQKTIVNKAAEMLDLKKLKYSSPEDTPAVSEDDWFSQIKKDYVLPKDSSWRCWRGEVAHTTRMINYFQTQSIARKECVGGVITNDSSTQILIWVINLTEENKGIDFALQDEKVLIEIENGTISGTESSSSTSLMTENSCYEKANKILKAIGFEEDVFKVE